MGIRLALFAAAVLVGCGAHVHEPHVAPAKPVAVPAKPFTPPPPDESPAAEGPLRVVRVLGDGAWRFSWAVTLGPKTADGRSVLAWTWKSVFVVDVATGQPQRTYPLPPTPDPYRNAVVAVAAGPAGAHAAALLADGTLLFWPRPDEAPASLVRGSPPDSERRTGDEERIAAIVQRRLFFSADGARLVAGMRIYGVAEERFLLEPRADEMVVDVDGEGREALVATVNRYRESRQMGCVGESIPRIGVERLETRRLGGGTKSLPPDLSAAFLPGGRLVQHESRSSTRLAVVQQDTGVRVTSLPSTWRDALAVSVPSNGHGFWYDDGETSALAAPDGTELWNRRGYIGPNPPVQRGDKCSMPMGGR
ncbi:hypothetical protein LVJ94_32965 [Pendulispora rubella]|uniref:Lipoprotein n=1 Tax=Pendulispora rubella TaxID=2741070 RepID=A0ABZ2KSN7_9BACT